ncbi:hypothetical protein [Hymenobacter sp. IS2118]|uniref:hypothetical protein n=1 Tax=Hymenobacter sp. IS2118 TaxID=1505605 RepID=UPI001267FC3F|nr:hypothetical protein [Hymenobacter sp. IS2118]
MQKIIAIAGELPGVTIPYFCTVLQPKPQLMKRGTLLGKDPREDRKVFATVGFSDFAAGISVAFLGVASLPFRIPKRFFYAQ